MGELLYALQWAPGLRAWLAHLPAWALLPLWALALASYGATQLHRKLRRPRYVPRHATRRPNVPRPEVVREGARQAGTPRPAGSVGPGHPFLWMDPLPGVRAA